MSYLNDFWAENTAAHCARRLKEITTALGELRGDLNTAMANVDLEKLGSELSSAGVSALQVGDIVRDMQLLASELTRMGVYFRREDQAPGGVT